MFPSHRSFKPQAVAYLNQAEWKKTPGPATDQLIWTHAAMQSLTRRLAKRMSGTARSKTSVDLKLVLLYCVHY